MNLNYLLERKMIGRFARAYVLWTGGILGTSTGLCFGLKSYQESVEQARCIQFYQLNVIHKASYLFLTGTTIFSMAFIGGITGFVVGPFAPPAFVYYEWKKMQDEHSE